MLLFFAFFLDITFTFLRFFFFCQVYKPARLVMEKLFDCWAGWGDGLEASVLVPHLVEELLGLGLGLG